MNLRYRLVPAMRWDGRGVARIVRDTLLVAPYSVGGLVVALRRNPEGPVQAPQPSSLCDSCLYFREGGAAPRPHLGRGYLDTLAPLLPRIPHTLTRTLDTSTQLVLARDSSHKTKPGRLVEFSHP